MKKMILGLMIMSSMSAFATDFTMTTDRPSTIDVHGCSQGEVGYPQLKNSITGEHTLTAKCLPIACAYTNEAGWPFAATGKWTVKLMIQTGPKRNALSEIQFDRKNVTIVKTGLSKDERDTLLQELVAKKACKKIHYDTYVPSI